MNKKLLFAAMSFAALTACTTDDFESQKVAEEVSPVQFEVLNNNDAFTRASMNGNEVKFSATDGDLFTLYHGAAALGAVTGYENATYSAKAKEGEPAVLTTPTMIKEGAAIMVWPVDSNFTIKPADNLSIKIPADQGGKVNGKEIIQYQIPYVSDQIEIEAYAAYSETAAPGEIPTAYKTAGYGRKYQIYMRPMASQLNVKADYANTDATIATLYDGGSEGLTGDEAIDKISVTSVDLLTKDGGATLFTTEIPVKFSDPVAATSKWGDVANNKWKKVTDFNVDGIVAAGQTNKLTTKSLTKTGDMVDGCKFLILPQAKMAIDGQGVDEATVVVNTNYGKVVVAKNGVNGSLYNDATEYAGSWYRYVSEKPAVDADGETTADEPEASGDHAGKYKTTANIEMGLKQTINTFSAFKATKGVVTGEPVGVAATRYVKVLLNHLDMTNLHITSDKQLRDVARVWKKLNLTPVTVFLDQDELGTEGVFHISQNTIKVINEVNTGKEFANWFKVKPCQEAGEKCNKIVITGGGEIQDIAFIAANGAFKADVELANETTAWQWKGTVKVQDDGVNQITNKGKMENTTGATLKTAKNDGTQNNVLLINDGTWTVSGGELNVQFDVTNNGTVTIASGAEYRQAKGSAETTFTNQATDKPSRFGGDNKKIGVVHNSGVFATLAATGSAIKNYGEIYHDAKNAKTYITENQTDPVDFAGAFGVANKMGMIILPYDNKDEDNISVKAALTKGFIAVAINADNAPEDGILNATTVGPRVNYIKIDGGITTVTDMPATQIKYVEFNAGETEIDWAVTTDQTYEGMMVLSPVNIKLGTTITVSKATYLGANMYVGGTFEKGSWNGYFGDTSANEATKYITF